MNCDKTKFDSSVSKDDLFHYTGSEGLKGIWNSRSIRATRFDFLNDQDEMKHFYKLVTPIIREYADEEISRRTLTCGRFRTEVTRAGGVNKTIDNHFKDFMRLYYEAIFEHVSPTFVTSFCTHDDTYDLENGLLSQWRGYGGSGFALVFDRESILELIAHEEKSFYYQAAFISKVEYKVSQYIKSEEGVHLLKKLAKSFALTVLEDKSGVTSTFRDFAVMSSLAKHQGFREECEVRIVSAPLTEKALAAHRLSQPSFDPEKPLKPVTKLFHNKKRKHIHYIDLAYPNNSKPFIKRIIVGPGIDKEKRYQHALSIVKGEIPVRISETPFIG